MLTVITPATSTRLTTAARAKSALGSSETDDVVLRAIDQASAAVSDHCRRVFARETVEERFNRCETFRGGALLSRSPVTTFVEVTNDETEVDPSEFAFDHETGRLYRQDASGNIWRWWGSLTVQYTAGFTLPADSGTWTLPHAVERAATLLVGMYLSTRDRDPMLRSESVEGVGSTSWWVPSAPTGLLSPEADSLLVPYVRMI